MDKKPKTIFQLDSSFTSAQWPEISANDQDTILELLCNLLTPIGQHRATNTAPSKGKRFKKRKRLEAKLNPTSQPPAPTPPPPEISSHVCIGLNSITRLLATSSRLSKPDTSCEQNQNESAAGLSSLSSSGKEVATIKHENDRVKHFSVIFTTRSSLPSALKTHLPLLAHTASLAYPSLPATRLVQLSDGTEERLCTALGLPRVSFLGLKGGAPHATSLVELVMAVVKEIEVPWLSTEEIGKYLPAKVNVIDTFVGEKVKREGGKTKK
ncbi:hypothetical protein B0O99DRAFT_599983 [Bisporella sp. PMI_857]|nr:hypothetical protein B0O99DRAFT_599983 [Bisporella sp. PMI_857]